MATAEQLAHDHLRLDVARQLEGILGMDAGTITDYFDSQPDEDEEPDEFGDIERMQFDTSHGHPADHLNNFLAMEVWHLEPGLSVKDGVKRVYGSLCEQRAQFEAAASFIFEASLGK